MANEFSGSTAVLHLSRTWRALARTDRAPAVSGQPANHTEVGKGREVSCAGGGWGWGHRWERSAVLTAAWQPHFPSSATASRMCPAGFGPGLGKHICEAPTLLWGRRTRISSPPPVALMQSVMGTAAYQGLSSDK